MAESGTSQVIIDDTTLRDGEQTAGVVFSLDDTLPLVGAGRE